LLTGRLSRPSLVTQFPLLPALSHSSSGVWSPPIPASLAYNPSPLGSNSDPDLNPDPFVLSPIVNLPPSFGSAYVGETFSCTLCASYDVLSLLPDVGASEPPTPLAPTTPSASPTKTIRDVRIKAEMKTPSSTAVTRLDLLAADTDSSTADPAAAERGADLTPGATMQRIVNFDLKEEGNHVLSVTVSYYEATDVSGRTRTFRKLYQFICKASLIVRTKPGPLPAGPGGQRRWVLEAQLENCGEDVMQLEKVALDLEPGLTYIDCNWEASGSEKPILHPGEIEQVCFVVEEMLGPDGTGAKEQEDRVVFGILGIGWRGEMGNRGFLSTGKLGARHVKPVGRKLV